MVIASLFGTGMAADAFFVAFRIPNLLRRLLAEGSLSASFIPVFTEYRAQKGDKAAWRLANVCLSAGGLVLLGTVILGIATAPWLVRAFAPGFANVPGKFQLTVLLTRIIFPYLFCVGLGAIFMGCLNSLGHFFAPALSPALLNLAIISMALGLAPHLSRPVLALAWGVVLGGVLQLFFQLPFLYRRGMTFRPDFDFSHPGLVRIGRLMLPTILGLAVTEVNVLVDTLLASFLPEGSVSYLYYGNRLMQFPLGLFGIALGTAIFPTLAQQAAEGELGQLKETFAFGMRLVLYVMLPATVGLMVLGLPIIHLLFERGEFTFSATRATAVAVFYYAVGLCAYAGVKVTVPVFYSLQDTKTPMRISVVCMLVNIVLNVALMIPLRHGGLALATALSSMLNAGWLWVVLRRRLGPLGGMKIAAGAVKIAIAAGLMGGVCWWWMDVARFLASAAWVKVVYLGGVILGGGVIYLLVSYVLRCEELRYLWQGIRG